MEFYYRPCEGWWAKLSHACGLKGLTIAIMFMDLMTYAGGLARNRLQELNVV